MRPLALALAWAALAAAAAAHADAGAPELAARAVAAYAAALEAEPRDARLEAFRHAERLFAKLEQDGAHNPDLYTNLGNAALQAERPGRAVLAYRPAKRLCRSR